MVTKEHKLSLSFYFGQIFFKIMARNKSEVSTFLTIIQEEGGDEGYGLYHPARSHRYYPFGITEMISLQSRTVSSDQLRRPWLGLLVRGCEMSSASSVNSPCH